ncbi:SDR family NAD(P)-dependent oxidoreductase [Maribrevibacterium harenarium]|uniref:SDR family NAD(P)-dependent oxidoreductase n=1 Tax=Maribrevibacterium harenarium TaxID=2589817 RepID=A0A501WR30_9GAMM|nr:SDR family NAD(P)-dependent oxidoreductase [Maribrevibacterium harenarium]TPE51818.1 SDR family NAD(P)-dependent oxidoreductase [Maribrevibacterium harenarium]
MSYCALIVGASGGIAQALIDELASDESCQQVYAVSQSALHGLPEKVTATQLNYDDKRIQEYCDTLAPSFPITKVFICNGVLHGEDLFPERKLEEIHADQLSALFHSNTIVPSLWVRSLMPKLKGQTPCFVTVFSARVGSIADNGLGGWYGYRASKAALNMMLKTYAVEYRRRAKNVKLLAFHPGTTDTRLSKPFQRSVPEGKLFTPAFVATQLLSLLENLPLDGEASYKDWEHKDIPW